MCASDLKQFAIVIAGAALAALHCGSVLADQHIICPAVSPTSSAKQDGAAPILGPLNEPWGELKEGESVKNKDGSYVIRYDLTGGVAPQLEKWLICYYRDDSYKAISLPTQTRECRIRTKEDRPANPATNRHYYRVLDVNCR